MNPESTQHSVLLLDDDKFLLDMYGMKFGREGFVVQTCFSTRDALNVLRQGFVPDVILFDLVMPGEDGFAFLQTLRKERLPGRPPQKALPQQTTEPPKARIRRYASRAPSRQCSKRMCSRRKTRAVLRTYFSRRSRKSASFRSKRWTLHSRARMVCVSAVTHISSAEQSP